MLFKTLLLLLPYKMHTSIQFIFTVDDQVPLKIISDAVTSVSYFKKDRHYLMFYTRSDLKANSAMCKIVFKSKSGKIHLKHLAYSEKMKGNCQIEVNLDKVVALLYLLRTNTTRNGAFCSSGVINSKLV